MVRKNTKVKSTKKTTEVTTNVKISKKENSSYAPIAKTPY